MHGSSVILIVILVSMLFAIFRDLSLYRATPPSFDVMPERGAVRIGARVFAVGDFFGVTNFNVSTLFIPGLSEFTKAFAVDCEDLFNTGGSCYSPVEDEVPKTLVGIFGVATPFGIFSPDAETVENSDLKCANFAAMGSVYSNLNLCSTAVDSLFYIVQRCFDTAYVTAFNSSTIAVISTITAKIIRNFTVGESEGTTRLGLTLSPDGTFAYVIRSLAADVVYVISTSNNAVIKNISCGIPLSVAFSPNNTVAYVLGNYGSFNYTICVVNTTNHFITNTISVQFDAAINQSDVVINFNSNFAYLVASWSNGTVFAINIENNSVILDVFIGQSGYYSVVFSPDGAFAYAINGDIYVINTASNSVIKKVDVNASVHINAAVISPDCIFAFAFSDDALLKINTTDHTVIQLSLNSDLSIRDVKISPDGTFAYVTGYNNLTPSNFFAVLDIYHGTLQFNFVETFLDSVSFCPAYAPLIAVCPVYVPPPCIGFAYITVNTNIIVINAADHSMIRNVSINFDANDLAFSPNGSIAYLTSEVILGMVFVVNTTDHTILQNISVGNFPRGVAFSPDGTLAYVVNSDNPGIVSVISTANHTVIQNITVGNYPRGVAFSPDGTFAYVTNYDDKTVTVIDTIASGPIKTVNVSNFPESVAFSPDCLFAYVTTGTTIAVINTANHSVLRFINLTYSTWKVAFSPTGKFAYVTNSDDSAVSVINTTDHTAIAYIYVGEVPTGVAFSPSCAFAYVVNDNNNNPISVINTADNSLSITNIPVGEYPKNVAFSPTAFLLQPTAVCPVYVPPASTTTTTTTTTLWYCGGSGSFSCGYSAAFSDQADCHNSGCSDEGNCLCITGPKIWFCGGRSNHNSSEGNCGSPGFSTQADCRHSLCSDAGTCLCE